MKVRTYNLLKVGVKYGGDTEYTFHNEPFTDLEKAEHAAAHICETQNRETCIALFQVLKTFKPE